MEILAPAGSMEALTAAVRCGADAVYVGGRSFSARASAQNFDSDELYEAARICHLHGVKLYRAMNTVIFDSETETFAEEVRISAQAGVDGLIIQDMGAAAIARAVVPDMPLHASTQMTIQTPLSVLFAAELGFVRTVPARELTLDNIREICDTGVETEVFVHGAQCMCLSGQCYMSALIGSRSANRGRCAQACRLPFKKGNDMEHLLSLKDMSLLFHTDELIKAGVASMKIEGRMKRPEYVAAAVTAFRHAIDKTGDLNEDMEILSSVFSRSGFTDGYLTGKTGRDMFGFRTYEDVKAAENVLPVLKGLYKSERKCYDIHFTLACHSGEPIRAHFECGGVQGDVYGDIPEKAMKREISAEDAEKSFAKLGDTVYRYCGTDADIEPGLAVSAAELNRLRREMCETADKLITEKNTPHYDTKPYVMPEVKGCAQTGTPLRVRISRRDELDIDADMLIAPIYMMLSGVPFNERVSVSLPAVVVDEKELLNSIEAAVGMGYTHFHADNFTHLGILRRFDGIHIHGGSGLNITNSAALNELAKAGLEDAVLSFELRREQITAMTKPIPCGIIAYGRLPLMTVRNVPQTSKLTDRTGRTFPVKIWGHYAEILNCDTLDVISSFNQFGVSIAEIALCDDPREAAGRFRRRESLTGKGYTNGLYRRGII